MDTGELSGLLKRLCKVCWAANVTNPITYVTQISYLLFLKMLEERDAQAEQDARDLGSALSGTMKTLMAWKLRTIIRRKQWLQTH